MMQDTPNLKNLSIADTLIVAQFSLHCTQFERASQNTVPKKHLP